MVTVNFKCKKCNKEFDCEVGNTTFGERLGFEHPIICEKCGILTLDEVELTELVQSQVGELFLNKGE